MSQLQFINILPGESSQALHKEVSEDIRRMLGYSIHPPFIGMVNGMHPKRLLEGL
ncbi:hypothetical protein [Parahaliea maris]|uniref:hypothetical protein n=1 Tax=Parahaliea maris TaxID=2716870 RepID=UPI001F1E6D83|nr:hypothetical protein [Parahaliea maris]